LHVVIDESGVTTWWKCSNEHVMWDVLTSLKKTRTSQMIVRSDDPEWIILPRRTITSAEELTDVQTFITRRLGGSVQVHDGVYGERRRVERR
jgi:hypothetical protein